MTVCTICVNIFDHSCMCTIIIGGLVLTLHVVIERSTSSSEVLVLLVLLLLETGECEAEVPNPVLSLLDRLKSPTTSNLPRKRKVLCNPLSGKKRSSGSFAQKDPNVPPSARVRNSLMKSLLLILLVDSFVKHAERPSQ